MTDAEFDGWAELHCEATGGNAAAKASLVANRNIFLAEWHATAAELGECTRQLVRNFRVPKFPSEHAEAVARELMALRNGPPRGYEQPGPDLDPVAPPACNLCRDTGLVAVPVPRCVHDGRIVCYPGTRSVLTGAVLCDAPQCVRGQAARERDANRDVPRRRPRYLDYCRRFGGRDVASLLREHEAAVADAARKLRDGPGQPEVAAAIRKIVGRAAPKGEAA